MSTTIACPKVPAQRARPTASGAPRPSSPAVAPRWWRELVLLGGVYALYSVGRLVVGADSGPAMRHAAHVLSLEGQVSPETWLNEGLERAPVLAVLASYWYSALHYTVTPAVLVWLHRRHPTEYQPARTALVGATLLGLVGFWLYPTAPPRMLAHDGFVDTLAQFSRWGWWSTDASAPKGMGGLTNELAAMPSLHVGWAVWVGWYVYRHAKSQVARALAIAYPVGTALVVMGTANHYLLDVVAGAALVGGTIAVVSRGRRGGSSPALPRT